MIYFIVARLLAGVIIAGMTGAVIATVTFALGLVVIEPVLRRFDDFHDRRAKGRS